MAHVATPKDSRRSVVFSRRNAAKLPLLAALLSREPRDLLLNAAKEKDRPQITADGLLVFE